MRIETLYAVGVDGVPYTQTLTLQDETDAEAVLANVALVAKQQAEKDEVYGRA